MWIVRYSLPSLRCCSLAVQIRIKHSEDQRLIEEDSLTTVLLLHPGEMGASIGENLVRANHRVLWLPRGRSKQTLARASAAELESVSSLALGLEQADLVLSVCPPEFAVELGLHISDAGFDGLFCDANAIAPSTADALLKIFRNDFVDGGIVGPPPNRAGATRLFLSGDRAVEVEAIFEGTFLDVHVLKTNPLAASAMKMCYAAYTKGTSALLLNIRALAESHGVTDALEREWNQSQPGLWTRSESAGPGVGRKAWRFAPEMVEIARTFDDAALPDGFHQAAAEIYKKLAGFKDVAAPHTRELVAQILSETG